MNTYKNIFSIMLILTMGLTVTGCAQTQSSQGGKPPEFVERTPQPATLTTHAMAPNVYWTHVGPGNSNPAFIIGDEGVIVIDTTNNPERGKKLQAEIAKFTDKPITTVILTHVSGDSVGGLSTFPDDITIIAQTDASKLMERFVTNSHDNLTAKHLPNHIVDAHELLTIHGVKFEFFSWGAGHMSSDLVVYLPEKGVVHGGALIVRAQPRGLLIKRDMGGSSETWVEAAKGMLALDADQYIVGHSNMARRDEVLNKQQLEELVSAVIAEREAIKELVAKGKTLEEIKVEVNDPPADWPKPRPGGKVFLPLSEVIYLELTDET